MKCIFCGKEAEYGIYCKDCLLERIPMITKIKELKLRICSSCGRIQFKNKWNTISLEEALKKYLKDAIVFNSEYQIKDFDIVNFEMQDIRNKPGLRRKIKVVIKVKAEYQKKTLEEFFELQIPFETTLCNKCRKNDTQYYEAILQLRINDKKIINHILKELNEKMEKRKVFSNKQIKQKNGIDIYITDMNFAKAFVKELKKRYGGEIKISRKIHTRDRQTSRDVYRLTVLYRLNENNKRID